MPCKTEDRIRLLLQAHSVEANSRSPSMLGVGYSPSTTTDFKRPMGVDICPCGEFGTCRYRELAKRQGPVFDRIPYVGES